MPLSVLLLDFLLLSVLLLDFLLLHSQISAETIPRLG